MRPGAFFIFPFEDVRPFRAWCGNCGFEGEHMREVVPCRFCEDFKYWKPKRPLDFFPPFRVGMRVKGRNCVGVPFTGTITFVVSRHTVCVDGTIMSAGLIDEILISP